MITGLIILTIAGLTLTLAVVSGDPLNAAAQKD